MIRNLAIIAGAGFLLSICCLWGSAVLGGPSIRNGWDWPGRWVINDDGTHYSSSEPKGPRQQGSRDLAWTGTDSLTINLPAEVTYTQTSDAPGVTISGAADVVEDVEISGGEIGIRGLDNFNWRRGNPRMRNANLHITVRAPAVERFELNGAAKVDIHDYNRDRMQLEVNGAADVSAKGRTKSLKLELNGASHADLNGLTIEDVNVETNGASEVSVSATNNADIEINGVGQVTLLGRPKSMSQAIHGLGRVRVDDSGAPAGDAEKKKS